MISLNTAQIVGPIGDEPALKGPRKKILFRGCYIILMLSKEGSTRVANTCRYTILGCEVLKKIQYKHSKTRSVNAEI